MFSKACKYGIKAMIYLALHSAEGSYCSLTDISANIDSPFAFTSKVLQQLAKNKLIVSLKGVNGGFRIETKKLSKINLLHIVKIIDGESLLYDCGLGLKICSDTKPCPIHKQYSLIREEIRKMLENTSLIDFSANKKKQVLILLR